MSSMGTWSSKLWTAMKRSVDPLRSNSSGSRIEPSESLPVAAERSVCCDEDSARLWPDSLLDSSEELWGPEWEDSWGSTEFGIGFRRLGPPRNGPKTRSSDCDCRRWATTSKRCVHSHGSFTAMAAARWHAQAAFPTGSTGRSASVPTLTDG